MSRNAKVQIVISIIVGCLFLGIAIFQWYDLYQIEQGTKEGGLSVILLKIYEVAGKWGVAAFYMPIVIYCFWRAFKTYKLDQLAEEYKSNNEEEK